MSARALPVRTWRSAPRLLSWIAATVVLTLGVMLWGGEAAGLISARPYGLTANDIAAVGVSPPPHARAPLGLAFTDLDGRRTTLGAALGGKPSVLVLADYGCKNLCGPALSLTRGALDHVGLTPDAYRLAVVGLDPATSRTAARAFVAGQGARALLGDTAGTPALARALGFRYRYDSAHGQFAHPVAAFVLAADGRLIRALSEIGLNGRDLRLALTEAGGGRIGGMADQIRAHCYGFDPVVGAYDQGVSALVKLASAVVLALALAVAGLAFGRQAA